MTLSNHLKALYPDAVLARDFIIQDDGNGPYIAHWDVKLLGPKPDINKLPPAPIKPPVDPLDVWDAATLRSAFNHEQRLRALEGKSALTLEEFKTAVRNFL